MEEVKNKYAREVTIYEADNGYLVRVSCSFFVCEGSAEKLCDDIQSYLQLNPEVLKNYGYAGTTAFKEIILDVEGEDEKADEEVSPLVSPAFAFLVSETRPFYSVQLLESKYEVTNGFVVLNHKENKAYVTQKEISPQ